jgi:hypothetical protein
MPELMRSCLKLFVESELDYLSAQSGQVEHSHGLAPAEVAAGLPWIYHERFSINHFSAMGVTMNYRVEEPAIRQRVNDKFVGAVQKRDFSTLELKCRKIP